MYYNYMPFTAIKLLYYVSKNPFPFNKKSYKNFFRNLNIFINQNKIPFRLPS